MKTVHNRRFKVIDAWRGIAALWVMLFHTSFSEQFSQAFPYLNSLADAGHLGVPMFFVISGFCITASAVSLIPREDVLREFVKRRFFRIYPTYWFSIAVVIALPFFSELLSALKTGQLVLPSSTNYAFYRFSISEWLRYFTLSQIFYPFENLTFIEKKFSAFNAVYWTLALEVQFYSVVFVALLFRKFFYKILAAVTLISLPFAALGKLYTHGIFLPYWPMFTLGIGVFILTSSGLGSNFLGQINFISTKWIKQLIYLLVCSTVGLIIAGYKFPDFLFALVFALGLLLALSRIRTDTIMSNNLVKERPMALARFLERTVLTLGAMSYSLYLIHTKVLILSDQVIRQLLDPGILFDISSILLALAIIYLFYLVCERPFTQTGKMRTPGTSN